MNATDRYLHNYPMDCNIHLTSQPIQTQYAHEYLRETGEMRPSVSWTNRFPHWLTLNPNRALSIKS